MPESITWEESALAPFLPFLPLNICRLVVVTTKSSDLVAGWIELRIADGDEPEVVWDIGAGFPEDFHWERFVPSRWNQNDRDDRHVGVILLPRALDSLSHPQQRQLLETIWQRLTKGDIMLLGKVNRKHARIQNALGNLRLFYFLKRMGAPVRAYICLERSTSKTVLKLVSSRYALQRAFISEAAQHMGVTSRMFHTVVSVLGIYPWMESEHVFVAPKC